MYPTSTIFCVFPIISLARQALVSKDRHIPHTFTKAATSTVPVIDTFLCALCTICIYFFIKISLRISQTVVYTDLPISAPCVEVSKHSPKLTNDVTATNEKNRFQNR